MDTLSGLGELLVSREGFVWRPDIYNNINTFVCSCVSSISTLLDVSLTSFDPQPHARGRVRSITQARLLRV